MLRNKLLYLCMLLYGIFFSILYDEYIIFALLIVLISLPVVLLVLLLLTVPFVSVELDRNEISAGKDEKFNVVFIIKNRSVLPVVQGRLRIEYYNKFGYDKSREKLAFFVDRKNKQIIRCQMTAPYCGGIVIGCSDMRIYDYFRLFSIRKKVNDFRVVNVNPDLREIKMELPVKDAFANQEGDVYSQSKPGDDPSEVFSIREYREGDRLHRIHWKLSSKKDQYMIKEYSLPVNCSAIVFLDFYYNGSEEDIYSFIDEIVERAVSLSYTFIMYEYVHYFIWYHTGLGELRIEKIEKEEDIAELIEKLFQAGCYTDSDTLPAAYAAMNYSRQVLPSYYIGAAGTKEFEGYGINPKVVDGNEKT